jgi:hypothetical protein
MREWWQRFCVLGCVLAIAFGVSVCSVWPPSTPTFPGTRTERFVAAMQHYSNRMGIEYSLHVVVVEYHPKYCAWVTPIGDSILIKDVQVGFSLSKECDPYTPEHLALHEACHLRMMHVEPALQMDIDEKHREVKTCMRWYGGTK